MPSNDELHRLRAFLVPRWCAWGEERQRPITDRGEGMCRFTSVFLELHLGRGWKLAGGSPEIWHNDKGWLPTGEFGFHDGTRWHGHHWLASSTHIIDLTASQFGQERVLVTAASDPRFRGNLFPNEIAFSRGHVLQRAQGWIREYRAEHRLSRPASELQLSMR